MEQLTSTLPPRPRPGTTPAPEHAAAVDLAVPSGLARELARLFADGSARVPLHGLMLLPLLAEAEGHVHLDLGATDDEDLARWLAQVDALPGAGGKAAGEPGRGELRALLGALCAGGDLAAALRAASERLPELAAPLGEVLGAPGQRTPLVLDGARLYTARAHRTEVALAAAVRARLAAAPAARTGPDPGAPDGALTAEQASAIDAALSRCLCVITGGPGTGKTTVVRALVARARERGVAPDAIALCAPTGKAAQRLTQALGDLHGVPAPRTVHRLLGFRPGDGAGPDRCAHHERNPLLAQLVVCDEAAMLDLHTLARLLTAVAPGAHLVLIGDADQLPPVGLGQAFADLCACPAAAPVRLTRGFRVTADDAGDSLRRSASLIVAGDRAALLPPAPGAPVTARASAREVTGLGAEWLDPELDATRDTELFAELWRSADLDGHFAEARALPVPDHGGRLPDATAASLRELLARLDRFRILTALRGQASRPATAPAPRLPRHAAGLNALCAAHARAGSGDAARSAPFTTGEPVVVRENDPARGLYNGDTGMVVGGPDHLRVAFPADARQVRLLPLRALAGNLDHAYALTVHRAQGSEFDRVALILPAQPIPLVSRALLYTALTRARRGALLVGSRAVIEAALARVDRRRSALAARLSAPAATGRSPD